MKILRNLLIASIALMPLAGFSQIQKGAGSIGLYGSLVSAEDTDTLILAGTYDYFVTDNWAIGISGMGAWNSWDGDDTLLGSVAGTVSYYWPGEKVSPYVGLGVGTTFVEFDGGSDSYLSYQGYTGFETYLSESTSIDVRLTYQYVDTDGDSTDSIMASIGFKFYFN